MFYYVYAYIDPRTELPFYIGKGHGNRAYFHLTESKTATKNIRKWNKIASIRAAGYEPQVTILKDGLTENAAYDLERTLIQQWGRKRLDPNGVLTNFCVDARPPGNPKAHLGKIHSESAKLKMAARKAHRWRITTPTGRTEEITNLSLVKLAHGHQKKPHKGFHCETLTE
jgi:hypothetical protein